ncbi:thioredoxin family protein [Chryseobacterium joostei]|uniref:AhpC/TSA family protein n=1 Tax=Chryseobacterium joostei TaxID=112234 RepID=A0A1N7J4T0_9FLAO|nr:thioredoxin fold domain-containing protein [Chryseobacterium joostei]AZB01686.1 thioredoxin family protein [Chryseobacterium joostei]SIS44309.1 AhpC/TSA family protein [Chryseobacterium joostei]
MKKIALFLMLVPCFYLSQMKTGTFSELEFLQKESPRPVVIHLYTDWCTVCKIESFHLSKDKDLVKMMNENFYLINFEAEKTRDKIRFQGQEFEYLSNGSSGIHELALALSKNKNQPVYPLWIFLDKNQNLVYYQEGQLTPEKMKQKLLEISVL